MKKINSQIQKLKNRTKQEKQTNKQKQITHNKSKGKYEERLYRGFAENQR